MELGTKRPPGTEGSKRWSDDALSERGVRRRGLGWLLVDRGCLTGVCMAASRSGAYLRDWEDAGRPQKYIFGHNY